MTYLGHGFGFYYRVHGAHVGVPDYWKSRRVLDLKSQKRLKALLEQGLLRVINHHVWELTPSGLNVIVTRANQHVWHFLDCGTAYLKQGQRPLASGAIWSLDPSKEFVVNHVCNRCVKWLHDNAEAVMLQEQLQ